MPERAIEAGMAASDKEAGPRGSLTFRFRGRTVALDRFAPRATLLDWLREEAGAKGTKEGCGEGDCGACTVVLSRLQSDGALSYEPVNACILLLGQVDGAEVLTVEDLAEGQRLHPVQQAMVDHHGSQCGFCTPGFVMSAVRALSPARGRRRTPACATRSPATSAAAPAIGRSSTRRWRPATASRPTASPPRPPSAPRRLAALADGRDLFVGDGRAFFAAPASEASLAALYARLSPRACWSAARPTSACGSPSSCAISQRSSGSAASPGSTRSRRASDALRIGARATLQHAAPHLAALHPDLGELMRRFGSRAGARARHGRRQHRQRLADRRSRAGADRARRAARAQQGRRNARPAARGLLPRLRQAGPRRRANSSSAIVVPRLRRGPGLSRLQGLQALRPGHFRRHGRVPLHARRAADRGRARRLRRHGGDAETRRERRGGARRRSARRPRPRGRRRSTR